MQLPPEEKPSPDSGDPPAVGDMSAEHTGTRGDEDLLENAPFPLYGIIGHPGGLTLRGTGYSTAFGHFDTPQGPWDADQPVLWCVSLSYDYPPASRHTGRTLQLSTIAIQRAPMQAPVLDADEMSDKLRYVIPEDVPWVRAEESSFVVERLPIMNGIVLAAMQYAPKKPPLPGVVKPIRLVWSFTLWNPPLWVGGRAAEWDLSELVSVLANLAMVSQRPDVLRQYQRELQAWDRYIQSNAPKPAL